MKIHNDANIAKRYCANIQDDSENGDNVMNGVPADLLFLNDPWGASASTMRSAANRPGPLLALVHPPSCDTNPVKQSVLTFEI